MRNPIQTATSILLLLSSFKKVASFTINHAALTIKIAPLSNSLPSTTTSSLHEKKQKKTSPAKGFGKQTPPLKPKISVTKTYTDQSESDNTINDDDTDPETAVEHFFSAHRTLHPLFRSILGTIHVARSSTASEDCYLPPLPLAAGILNVNVSGGGAEKMAVLDDSFWVTEEDASSTVDVSPWNPCPPAVPTSENDVAILGAFLDAMQKALVEIPVDELKKEDSNDLHFIEEGRRCLVITRFQVYGDNNGRDEIDVVDAVIEREEGNGGPLVAKNDKDEGEKLTTTVWTEIARLVQDNEADTGSLIILPDTLTNVYEDVGELKEFTERNISKPLDWLGLGDTFEVASMQRGSLAIRLIYKLSDIPEPQEEEEEEEEGEEKESD